MNHNLCDYTWQRAFICSTMWFAIATAASGQGVIDRVRLVRGNETGEVIEMSPFQLKVKKGQTGTREVAVNEVKSIQFEDEPPELSQARLNAANGAYQNALESLAKIDVAKVNRDFIKQDIDFYRGWCAARLALAGQGEISDAGRQLNAFVQANPNNFHYLAAREAMGDLLMAGGAYAKAEVQYAELAQAPWPEYKMRAAVVVGRSLQAQNKHAEAIKQFDAVLATPGDDTAAQNERLSATLGKAISLAETGSVDQAVGMIEKVIHDADPQQKELHARAYNSLGTCYEKAGKTKEALLAFLHVDVLYSSVPEAHAEALSHLAELWKAIGHDDRARESRQTLSERYGGSRWAN